MATLDFFAVRDDLIDLLQFIYAETNCTVFESYSGYDAALRKFESVEELDAAYPIGIDPYGNGMETLLQLYSPSVAVPPRIKRSELRVPGHSFRYCVESAGLIQLYLGGLHQDVVTLSHFGHWNEAGAMKRCVLPADEVHWPLLRSLSGKLQRHIKNRLSYAKVGGLYVMRQAFSHLKGGKFARAGQVEFGVAHPDMKVLSAASRLTRA